MNGLLVGMYPARWRERYEEEFRALLEERPPGPLDVIDIAFAALHTRLNPAPSDPAQAGPTVPRSLRIGGWAAILGGLLWIVAMLGLSNHDDSNPLTLIVLAMAEITLLVALVALSAFLARRHPGLAWFACLVPAAGMVISLGGIAAMSLNGDVAVVAGLSGWGMWVLGIMAFAVGSVAFAAACGHEATFRTARYLGVSTVIFIGTVVLTSAGGLAEVGTLTLVVGWIAHAVGWIKIGAEALRLDGTLVAPSPG